MTDIHESLKPLAVSIDSLTPDPSNARKHDKRNIEAIKASLARFGQTKPIVLHTNGTTIIAGNGTWHAAKELGWTHIAAAKTNLDTAEAVAYGIADNKTAELAEWEDDTLRDLMDALPDDLKLATGFEGDEIAEMLRLPSDEVHETKCRQYRPIQQLSRVISGCLAIIDFCAATVCQMRLMLLQSPNSSTLCSPTHHTAWMQCARVEC